MFCFDAFIINGVADFVNRKLEIIGEILENMALLEILCRSGEKRVEARNRTVTTASGEL